MALKSIPGGNHLDLAIIMPTRSKVMTEVWKIEKYARYLSTSAPGKGQWQQYDDSDGDLVLTLTESSYLILCKGTTIMESHCLVTARAWMRGMTKRDSMLLMYKVKNETRRFRLKFYDANNMTGDQQCSRCAEKLSRFFPVKLGSQTPVNTVPRKAKDSTVPSITPEEESLHGEVTLGKMAQVLSGQAKIKLPLAYQQCVVHPEEIDTLIRLCLTDPTFPAFVEKVEQQLLKVITDSS